MRRWVKIVLVTLGLVAVLAAASGFWLYRISSQQKQQIQAGAESLNEFLTTPAPSGSTPNPDNFDTGSFTFNSRAVGRINGRYDGITAKVLRFTGDNREIHLATISDSTKVVCQPTGYLLNNQSDIPANQIYIEDQTEGNSGIPWGVQIANTDIGTKALVGSDVDVYYDLQGGLVNSLTAAYVWIKDCQN